MLLCLDIGNTNIFGGVFVNRNIKLRFRTTSRNQITSDEVGLFLKQVLRENGINPDTISAISLSSVVPDLIYSIRAACIKYFNQTPYILTAENINLLKINYHAPKDLGSDRIANAIAAVHHYPNEHLIIVDFGTATTICAVSKTKEYLGGAIMPGLRLSMNALQNNTALLKAAEIIRPKTTLGQSTKSCIQSGLYYGQLGAIEAITKSIKKQEFLNDDAKIIGTGGFAHMFENTHIFDAIIPDLVLEGLSIAFHSKSKI